MIYGLYVIIWFTAQMYFSNAVVGIAPVMAI